MSGAIPDHTSTSQVTVTWEKEEILILHHLLRGKIVITDHKVNEYIEKHYKDSFGEKLKGVKILFIEEGLRLYAALKPHNLLPDVVVEINLALDSFDFRPGAHIFNFKFTEKPKLDFPEQRNSAGLRVLNFVFEKIVGSKRIIGIVSRNLKEMEFLTWDYDRVALDLDKHPEAQKLFDKRAPLIGTKIFDYVGIKEILFGKGEVVLKPKIYADGFVEKIQDIREQVAAGREPKETADTAERKQIFSRVVQRVKQFPDVFQAHVEQELPKLKETTAQIGGKLWDGINYLWEAMNDPDVPQEAKFIAIAALLYFVSPIDLISDFLPVGYADDGLVLALAVKAVADILEHHEIALDSVAT
ncbi:MAG: YkvA family protein [Syntrophaceticus sp.]